MSIPAKLINHYQTTISNIVVCALFFLCLLQFSLKIDGTGVSANYLYMFFPFIFMIPSLERRLIFRREVALIISVLTIIYLLRIPFEIFESDPKILRRFGSFLVFIFPLTLAFIEFKKRDLYLFKMAVLLVCIFYGFHKMILFFTLILGYESYFLLEISLRRDGIGNFWGDTLDGIRTINLKGIVGSQRFGFMYIFGLFIALFEPRLFFKRALIYQRIFLFLIIFFSCILTFSRATIVALFLAAIYLIWRKFFSRNNYTANLNFKKSLKIKVFVIVLSILFVVFISWLFYFYGDVGILSYYKTRFIQPFLIGTDSFMTNPNSSEGYRVVLISYVIDYVTLHPLTGSAYQGLSLLFDEFNGVGSVHNQYFDVFLRVGAIGFGLWAFLLFRIFKFCKTDNALLFGFVGILFYGLVHETFKLSYGSFIFGVLLSFSYSLMKVRDENIH
tara:strand:+ start:1842 stop:3176 length:1335 start_codon:yes stop_codon:yes gene_type:complete